MSDTYADRVIREAMTAATGGLDPDLVENAITKAVEAIEKQMAALAAKDYAGVPAHEIARAVAHTTKAGDVLYRLAEFARGKPDSRPDLAGEWLKMLSDDQLAIVTSWIDAKAPEKPRARKEAERDGRD